MQAVEALQRLIALADQYAPRVASEEATPEVRDGIEQNLIAIAIAQAMLNTALPVARFRAFVEIDDKQPKRTAYQASVAPKHEFTICAVDMDGILSGLIGVTSVPTNVKVSLFEQRATGADMLSGYQGQTKTGNYKRFLEGLKALEALPTVQ